jgi:hypothetical protein
LTCTAADKVLGPKGQERMEVNETAEAMQIEEPILIEPALLPTPQVSFFDHDQQVFDDAFQALKTQRPDLKSWAIEWEKIQTGERKLYFPSEWDHASIPPMEDDLNPVYDWSIRLAFLRSRCYCTEANSAWARLIKIIFEDERSAKRYEFAARRLNDYTPTTEYEPYYPPIPYYLKGKWYTGLWGKAMHRLDSAINTAKQSINTVREAVDYASQVLTSFNVYPAEPGNSSDDMQFRHFTNTLNTFDLKSKWTSFESRWEQFTEQVSKLGVGTKGWPPDGASLGELLDSLRPGFG